MGFMDRARKSYNVLIGREDGQSLPERDTRTSFLDSLQRVWRDSTSQVLAPIVTRISVDVSMVPVRHVYVDEYRQFTGLYRIKSELDDRIFTRANLDQSGSDLMLDAAYTILTTGSCVFVAIETPFKGSMTPLELRVGSVVNWNNRSVEVSLYDENTGDRKDITLSKHEVAIAYSPLSTIINAPNSTAQRLIDKLSLLDLADRRASLPGLDVILQFPHAIKNQSQKEEAIRRVKLLEEQLYDSRLGIGYVGATERITQLNRPVTNQLHEQVARLEEALYKQLGLTPSVFDGTASEEEMLAFYSITRDPILKSITNALATTYLSRTAITQGQWVLPVPEIFKMAPLATISEAADKLTRNAILSSNEIRQGLRLAPVDTKEANELSNKNMPSVDKNPEGESIDEANND